jgi:hypothetical protein
MFVEPDEIADCLRKPYVLDRVEGVDAQRVVEPGDNDRKTERIESSIEQAQIVTQRRQLLGLLFRDVVEDADDLLPQQHSVLHQAD